MKPIKRILLLTALLLVTTMGIHAQTANTATKYKVFLNADDKFEFFVNGNMIWSGGGWRNIHQKEILLKKGDIIVVRVTDFDGGPKGMFAIIIKSLSNKTLLKTKDFRYSVNPPANFSTSPDLKETRTPDLDRLSLSFGLGKLDQPKKAWTHRSDRMHGVVYFKCIVE